ncbi:MAG: hypothetical protein IIB54_06395 [Planctomycetes bacterium]|nr:hypothetical protein [Planctomycetota bacterium]
MPIVNRQMILSGLLVASCLHCWHQPALSQAQENAQSAIRPRILVANDDGIAAPGLHALVRELSSFADIVVVAPENNRSGSSHSLSLYRAEMTLTRTDIEGALEAYAVNGSPADAVNIGLLHVGREKPFDLVVTGINHGANVGVTAHISGTVGSAMEAALNGVPATAPELIKGVAIRRMGSATFRSAGYRSEENEDSTLKIVARLARRSEAAPDSDTLAFRQGDIIITPLRIDWTDEAAILDVRGWDLPVAPEGR